MYICVLHNTYTFEIPTCMFVGATNKQGPGTYSQTYIHLYVYTICTHVCMHAYCMYVCTYVCMHACIHGDRRRDFQNPRSRNLGRRNKSTPTPKRYKRGGVLLFRRPKFRERGFWISPSRGGTFCDQCRDCLDGKQASSRQLASIKQATGNAQHANEALCFCPSRRQKKRRPDCKASGERACEQATWSADVPHMLETPTGSAPAARLASTPFSSPV